MSELLKKNTDKEPKKNNLLKKSNAPKPSTVFGRDKVFAAAETPVKKKSKKTTTIRCDVEVSNHLNAISAVMNLNSVNELLEIMIANQTVTLKTDEQREVQTIKKIYDKRSR